MTIFSVDTDYTIDKQESSALAMHLALMILMIQTFI